MGADFYEALRKPAAAKCPETVSFGGEKKALSNFISKIIKIMDFGKCFTLLH